MVSTGDGKIFRTFYSDSHHPLKNYELNNLLILSQLAQFMGFTPNLFNQFQSRLTNRSSLSQVPICLSQQHRR